MAARYFSPAGRYFLATLHVLKFMGAQEIMRDVFMSACTPTRSVPREVTSMCRRSSRRVWLRPCRSLREEAGEEEDDGVMGWLKKRASLVIFHSSSTGDGGTELTCGSHLSVPEGRLATGARLSVRRKEGKQVAERELGRRVALAQSEGEGKGGDSGLHHEPKGEGERMEPKIVFQLRKTFSISQKIFERI